MSRSHKDADTNSQATVSMQTSQLREKLNQVFSGTHSNFSGKRAMSRDASFDNLWDLKESAILEGRKTVDIPEQLATALNQAVYLCSNISNH